jgi:hypothetical protein
VLHKNLRHLGTRELGRQRRAGSEHLADLGAAQEDEVLLLVTLGGLAHHDHFAHHVRPGGVIGFEDLDLQLTLDHVGMEDLLGLEGTVVIAHARVVAADDQVRAAHVLAEQRVQHGLAGTAVQHVEAVARDLTSVGREVQLDHLANGGVAHVGGDVALLELAQQHVDDGALAADAVHADAHEFLVGAVHGVAGLEGGDLVPAVALDHVGSADHRAFFFFEHGSLALAGQEHVPVQFPVAGLVGDGEPVSTELGREYGRVKGLIKLHFPGSEP